MTGAGKLAGRSSCHEVTALPGSAGDGPKFQVRPMLVSSNGLWRCRIQLSPLTAVTEISAVSLCPGNEDPNTIAAARMIGYTRFLFAVTNMNVESACLGYCYFFTANSTFMGASVGGIA